ncbi:SAM-dependent methyltransferase [Streptomyces sp. NBC_00287]|uniref:SAM-dependent methyltransferase n=1 Tax=Streptomyces sp. NBC_00287 TaxID=2975702 RepID=UPI002E2DEF5E|nr:SAM-dependent methyltransferase [Streptomyces sp. NBC_00287]
MPVIRLFSPDAGPGTAILEQLAADVTELLRLPAGHCWVWWHRLEPGTYHRPEWRATHTRPAPVGFVVCKESYNKDELGALLRLLQARLAELLDVPADEIFLTVQRAVAGELLVRDEVWFAHLEEPRPDAVTDLVPIGVVHTDRGDLSDDDWGDVTSVIRLDGERFTSEALLGLDSFSHLEVVFHFHRVAPEKAHTGARHPRGNPEWPRAGIFAQRAKNRPNRIGVSRCKLLKVDGLDVHVRGLDAVDGTPVLDIKPYLTQFGPREDVVQPAWVDDLMRDYY